MILDILNQIAATPKTTEKLAILKLHKNNDILRIVFYATYNTRIVYGIKKVPVVQEHSPNGYSLLNALCELKTEFATRNITGNAAIERLTEILEILTEDDAEVLRRVIMRDLECGASATTACKVWGDDFIPTQPCMKASSQSDKSLANIVYPAIAQLKADGTRCMIVKQDNEVRAWSRNGKEFIGIEPILQAFRDLPHDNFVLDGELVYNSVLGKAKTDELSCGNDNIQHSDLSFLFGESEKEPEVELSKSKKFNATVADRSTGNGIVGKSLKGTLSKEEADNIVFQCWDTLKADDYWNGIADVPYSVRMKGAQEIIREMNSPHIQWIETHVVNSLAEAQTIYEHYIEMELEGIILKNLNGIWEDKRSKDQVKFKAVIDFDGEIIGYYPHRKDPSKLGGFTIRSKCGRIQCNVGSGLKDGKKSLTMAERDPLDRTLLMSLADTLIGSVLEMECNGVVKRKDAKPGEAPYKLFLPVAKLVRTDKDAIDANTMFEVFGK